MADPTNGFHLEMIQNDLRRRTEELTRNIDDQTESMRTTDSLLQRIDELRRRIERSIPPGSTGPAKNS